MMLQYRRRPNSMKLRSLFCLGLSAAVCLGQTVSSESASPSEQEQKELHEITQRIDSGDHQALLEAAKFPAHIAIPYIIQWANPNAGWRLPDDIVRAALIRVHGYADYFRADIAKAGAIAPPYKGMVPGYDFDMLSLIATHEAAAIVAPYLFDFQMRGEGPSPGSNCGTCTLDANCDGAVLSLERMNLGDAPYGEHSLADNSVILIAWQKWAITKGYVPKSWTSKVKAPDWMLNMEKFGKMGVAPATSSTSTNAPISNTHQ